MLVTFISELFSVSLMSQYVQINKNLLLLWTSVKLCRIDRRVFQNTLLKASGWTWQTASNKNKSTYITRKPVCTPRQILLERMDR
jgi:hypothetical protein